MRRGITLIELLVVIFIMLLITAIAIPVMIPSVESRRLRETSRLITSEIQKARTNAVKNRSIYGVTIEPLAGQASVGATLAAVSGSDAWAGDTVNSRAFIRGNLPAAGSQYGLLDYFVNIQTGAVSTEAWQGLIRPGDTFQSLTSPGTPRYTVTSGEPYTDLNGNGTFNAGEPYADLDGDSTYDAPQLDSTNTYINALPWTLTVQQGHSVISTLPQLAFDLDNDGVYDAADNDKWNGTQFQVFVQPQPAAVHPLQLPNAMVIDLDHSGTSTLTLAGLGPVSIIFSPTGSVKSIYYKGTDSGGEPVTGPIFLLVGKQEKVGNASPNTNYEEQGNFWVTINPQTGLVTSTEIGPDADGDGVITLAESRYFALRSMALTGR